jgi:hypothetical protein
MPPFRGEASLQAAVESVGEHIFQGSRNKREKRNCPEMQHERTYSCEEKGKIEKG